MTKYGKNVTTLNNIKKLVKTLLVLADGEMPNTSVSNHGLKVIFDEDNDEVFVSGDKLKVKVWLKWVNENQLQISGKVLQPPNNELDKKGFKKSDLLTLLECSGENLELPPPKTKEKEKSEQERKNQAIQGVLECLQDLEILEDKSPNKNQGYWIVVLTLDHQTKKIADNLKYIEAKFTDKFPSVNIKPVQTITKPDSDREKPGAIFLILGDFAKSGSYIADADLSELSSKLSSIIQDKTIDEMVKKAYQDSLPLDADLWVKGASDLNQMLSELDQIRKLGDFLIRLSQDQTLPLEYQSYLKNLAEKLEVKKSDAKSQYPRAKYLDSYLMIKIEPNNLQPQECPKEFIVNGWLLMDDSPGEPDFFQFKPILDGNETAAGIICQKNRLSEVVNKFVNKAKYKLINESDPLNIEFFLPMSLMVIPVDQWLIDDSRLGQRPLGVRYPIRLRSLERMELPYLADYRCNWQHNWDKVRTFLEEKPGTELFEHLPNMENLTSEGLALSLKEKIGIKVTCLIPQDKTEELFNGILLATTPIALWTRCEIEPHSSVSAEIDRILSQPLKNLCKSVQDIREKAKVKKNEQHLGCHLSLLWDNPYRLLPDTIAELKKFGQS